MIKRYYFYLKSPKNRGWSALSMAEPEAPANVGAMCLMPPTKLCGILHSLGSAAHAVGFVLRQIPSWWQRGPPADLQLGSPVEGEHFSPSGSCSSLGTDSHWLSKVTCPSLNQSLWLEGWTIWMPRPGACTQPRARGWGQCHPTSWTGMGGMVTQRKIEGLISDKGGRETGGQRQQKI